jgi:hypothetical protein
VVSNEEVAVGRKGSGGAWGMGHGSRPAGRMRGWQGQPRKMAEYEHWRKIKRKGRSLGCMGCNVVVLKMTCSQSGCKVQ